MDPGFVMAWVAVVALSAGPIQEEGTFASRLERAASGDFDGSLMLQLECQTEGGLRSATIFGGGVGVSNGRTQFALERDRIQSLLLLLTRSGFASMPERFGGRDDPRVPRRKRAAVVICRVLVKLDDETQKEVVQLEAGGQSGAFKRLARDLLQAVETPARSGVTPTSLTDALRKLADGDLAPVTLEVIAAHGAGRPAARGSVRWLLTLSGGSVEAQLQGADGLGDIMRLRPDAATVRELARVLVDNDAAALPDNLQASDYTNVNLRVLAWKKSIEARPFAGARAVPGAPEQQRFQRILDALRVLQRRVRAGK